MSDKFLFCGLGSIGNRHLNNLLKLKPEARFLAYRTRLKKEPSSSKMVKIKEFDNFKKALKQNPKAVFVTNPTSFHLATALTAAKSGLNLFIEKPLATNTQGVIDLIKICKKQKLISLVGYVLRFHPQIKKIKEIIQRKSLGKIYTVQAIFSQNLSLWHPWENYLNIYSSQKKLGGGILLDASHELDYLYWFFGKVAWVQAWVGKLSNFAIDVEDTALITLKFANNVMAEIHLDYLGQPPQRKLVIIGQKGSLYWDFFSHKLAYYDAGTKKWTKTLLKNFNYNKMYLGELKYFLQCLETKRKPLIGLEDGFYVLKIIEAARQSSLGGKRIYL